MTDITWRMEDGSLVIGSADFTPYLKEISVGGGDATVEVIRTAGNNQYVNMQPVQPFEIEITTHKVNTDGLYFQLGGKATVVTGSAYEVNPRAKQSITYTYTDQSSSTGEQFKMKALSAWPAGRTSLKGGVTDPLEETTRWIVPVKYYQEFYTNNRTASVI